MARHTEIYKSPEWEPARQVCIRKASGLCEECKRKGKVKAGKEVDHIVELTDDNKNDWNIAYNVCNLQHLCSDCHNNKHDRNIGLQKFITPPG